MSWPMWRQERAGLEHKMLTRGMYKALLVIADAKDQALFKNHLEPFIPDRHGLSDTILFLKSEKD